jgi:peptide deformylase
VGQRQVVHDLLYFAGLHPGLPRCHPALVPYGVVPELPYGRGVDAGPAEVGALEQQGDPLLTQVATPFDLPADAENASDLIDDLLAAMARVREHHVFGKGMGLAAFDVRGLVPRPLRLEVEHTTLDGHRVVTVVTDGLARLVAHEIDHLYGHLYTDRTRPDLQPISVTEHKGTEAAGPARPSCRQAASSVVVCSAGSASGSSGRPSVVSTSGRTASHAGPVSSEACGLRHLVEASA